MIDINKLQEELEMYYFALKECQYMIDFFSDLSKNGFKEKYPNRYDEGYFLVKLYKKNLEKWRNKIEYSLKNDLYIKKSN